MKRDVNDLLECLLTGAAHGGARRDESMPFGFDTRVLARRNLRPAAGDLEWFLPVVRGVLALSLAITLVVGVVTWSRLHSTPVEELAFPGYATTMGLAR